MNAIESKFPRTTLITKALRGMGYGVMSLDDLRLMRRFLTSDGPSLTKEDVPKIKEMAIRIDAAIDGIGED